MPGQQYDSIVRNFLEEEGGVIVYLSDDSVFIRALRNIVSRVIGLKGELLFPFSQPEQALVKCLELRDNNIPCILFVERMLGERPTTDFIIRLSREFPGIRMIVLTWKATLETVAYFFELGVSRVLVKPASANKVIEELAATINPPSELKRQMDRCAAFLADDNFDEALEVTDRILILKPDSARGLAMRGDALMGIGETDKAMQAYIAAHESKPIFMAPLIKLAAAFKDMDHDRALGYMKQLDEISPLNPERKIDIAEEHLRRNEQAEAEAYLDKSMEVAEAEQLSMVGDLTERIADAVAPVAPNLAIKYLNRAIDSKRVLSRDDLIHFNRLGIILRGEGQWKEAVDVYMKALTIAPDDPIIHYNMGLAYWEGNERTTAMKSFEQALSLDPEFYKGSIGAALNVGSLFLDMRQYDDAEPYFEHVLELDPENHTAKKRLNDARNRIPPSHTPKSKSRSTETAYDVDATNYAVDEPTPQEHRKNPPSGNVFNVDKMSEKPKAKKSRKKNGTTFNVDELSGSTAPPPSEKERPAPTAGFNVDELGDTPAAGGRRKKKTGKVTKLDF
ncbi:tetratricopeptide repeat protein [uncultured Pseudodesulfovibrio sp.]|uniref:tetratricopeptide repeat protein n=1 Tax=uncultured Pseudodesulfovibrio sp. TaxID=2035858 RepID=UPI0029C799BE|nr:tetratricopeptide repeat protein [uncultured Pseudodesulfovibrio sp.]